MPTLAELNADLVDRTEWLRKMKALPITAHNRRHHITLAISSLNYACVQTEHALARIARTRGQS